MNISKIPETLTQVKKMMENDSVSSENSESISKITNNALTSEKFYNSIKADIDAIMKDGKIAMNDVPRIMSIILKSEGFLLTLSQSVQNGSMPSVSKSDLMKYVTYGLLHLMLVSSNTTQEDIDSFDCLFPGLWSLSELSLPALATSTQKVKSGCC